MRGTFPNLVNEASITVIPNGKNNTKKELQTNVHNEYRHKNP